MISNKSKSIILLAGIMLSSATFIIGTNNNNYEKNTALYSMNTKADESEALKTTDVAKVENTISEVIEKEEIATEKTNIIEENTSNDSYMTNEVVDSSNEEKENIESTESVNNKEDINLDNSTIESEIEDKNDIELDTDKKEENTIDSDINNDNIIAEETPNIDSEEENSDINIAGVENTIPCPPLSEAPTFTVGEGINENGIGDSVYEHLKEIGWTAVDENTIKINDDRLQFKNMNGQGGVDSIITMTCDFEENDKYYLYLLKLMIGDKSVSTANPTESEIFSGAFDDTYYDNFENLVRRIANGSGMIKYSNRNIRVQYDGKLDYTITITFYNYTDSNSNAGNTPSIGGDINIVY